MSSEALVPANLDQLRQTILEHAQVLPVGNRTKPPLSREPEATLVSLRSLRGMIEYEPSEFTFTAWAGTTVAEIQQELRGKRQYLPFDPMLVDAGATLGGTIAAGLSGPGRFRFGGVRDFLIGVKLLGGDGVLVQGGGKVVKNAAGFDLPKFLVGSLGRYGLMVEVSFKVFPQPLASITWCVRCDSHRDAMQRIATVAASRWEADAVDYRPADRTVLVRLAGPMQAIDQIVGDLQSRWPGGQVLDPDAAEAFWKEVRELTWSGFPHPLVVKVPTTIAGYLALQEQLDASQRIATHLSVAGNLAWIAMDNAEQVPVLVEAMKALGLAGLVVRGDERSLRSPQLGIWQHSNMQQAVKQAMDPQAKFPGV